MAPDQIMQALEGWDACEEAREWALGKDLPAIYACDRGEWLYWLLDCLDVPVSTVVQLAIDAARLSLPYAGELHAVCLEAIEAAEACLADPSEANVKRCRDAADAAWDAAVAACAAAYAAACAAYWAVVEAYAAYWVAGVGGENAYRAAYWVAEVVGPKPVAECFRARISEAEFVRIATEAITRILTPKP